MKKATAPESPKALKFDPFFTEPGVHPFDRVEWELRVAEIKDWTTGKASFRQEDIEFPKSWSQRATDIVASKYFRGQLGSPDREFSIKQLTACAVSGISSLD